MSMDSVIIDTNVALTADGKAEQAKEVSLPLFDEG